MAHSHFLIAVSLVVLGACGGSTGGTSTTPEPDVTGAPVTETPDAGAPAATEPASAALTAENCEGLLDHMSQLLYEEKIRVLPEAERPTKEDLQLAKDQLRQEMMQQCVGAAPALFAYDCAMAAQNIQALGACMPRPEGG